MKVPRTPEQRTEAIAQHDVARLDGIRAQRQLEVLKDLAAEQQKELVSTLIARTRTDREIDTATVWELVALERLMESMVERIQSGRHAEKRIRELTGDNNG